MTRRREFLKAAGGALMVCLPGRPRSRVAVLREVRRLLGTGGVGTVRFCRVSHRALLPAARFVLEGACRDCIVDIDPAADGVVILGSRATLAVTRAGYRRFSEAG